ncbi:phosphodiester glycosidase family protein [Aurantiacibacter sp. D1-12]|uniref:phosphodiester glycosidase family protein n=1 Tax=Aurantiacibacter sp. D1-12 TaxID=2993658 RepID=UPI00237CA62A|nr:phosphodiester glycosidase family protein [Aurantiacibacter sp. D1-12]MDE1466649.1 phosphodiester glycosidase family protein [Aurantiacibacter sp. D1-12]
MNGRTLLSLALIAALTGCDIHFERDAAEDLTSICSPVMFEEVPFTQCTADPAQHAIDMDLRAEGEDAPFRSLRALSESDRAFETPPIVFATNGGMFDDDGMPIGYFVEHGHRLTVLNQNEGPGNFHLLPNGVFFGESPTGPWDVMDTDSFAERGERPYFATQSGPMLVVNGELHPQINPDGTSLRIRNAVGVDGFGRAHFVMSEAPVSFGKLARYFRDVLNVRNALYLDGTVSQMWDPADGRLDTGQPIGPLIVVTMQEDAS